MTTWMVRFEIGVADEGPYEGWPEDVMLDALAELGLAESAVTGGGRRGHVAARFCVAAPSAQEAFQRGLSIFLDAIARSGISPLGEPDEGTVEAVTQTATA